MIRSYLAKQLPLIWQNKFHPIARLFYPLSLVYRGAIFARKMFYKAGLLSSVSVSKPVIIVGNITVGGTGKTPLVIWMVDYLKSKGINPGIVSRGYGGSSPNWPVDVDLHEQVEVVGDEALLLRHRCNVPVVVSPARVDAANYLIKNHDVDIIISDDGLQHLALNRDIEVIVIDAKQQFGNGFLLPAGPLREPVRSISKNAIKVYGVSEPADTKGNSFKVLALKFRQVNNPEKSIQTQTFSGKQVNAVAGIGLPEKFFITLESLGIVVHRHIFGDHHQYVRQDLDFNDELPILMTEKDAVKCQEISSDNTWFLEIIAKPNSIFIEELNNALKTIHL